MDPDEDPDELKRQAERNIASDKRESESTLQKAQKVVQAQAKRDREVLDELRAIRKGVDALLEALKRD